MASLKVIAGDFGQGKSGQVMGYRYRPSSQGLIMPRPASSFQTERIAPGQIEALEVATEEGLKKMAGSIGWGVAGAIAAGPIGALAGTLAGGKSTEVTFICRFKDGRSFLGQCNTKTFTLIQAARFPLAASSVARPNPIVVLVALACLVGFFVWVVHLVPDKPTKRATSTLNQPAVGLVTYLLTDDAKGMLVRNERSAVWPKIGALLGWLDLAWSLPATSYESDYDANEISADNEYKGQRLLISGTISAISKDFANEALIVEARPSCR